MTQHFQGRSRVSGWFVGFRVWDSGFGFRVRVWGRYHLMLTDHSASEVLVCNDPVICFVVPLAVLLNLCSLVVGDEVVNDEIDELDLRV